MWHPGGHFGPKMHGLTFNNVYGHRLGQLSIPDLEISW